MKLAIRYAGAAALAVVISGCVVGPHYQPPGTPTSANGNFVAARPGAAGSQTLPPYWWRLYDDPILDRLVQQALVENEDLKVAAANIAYAQGLLAEAKAGRFPTTDLTAGAGYGRSAIQVFADQPAGFGYTAGLAASYQIDLFGRVRRTVEAARASLDATQAAEDVVRVTVAAETASAYADICGYAQEIASARDSLEVVQQTYDYFVIQRRAGVISDFEVDLEGVQLQQAKAALAPLEGQRRAALFTLAALLGKTPAEVPADAAACQSPPTLSRPLPVGDGAALLRRRPDLREAERTLAAATAQIGVAAADLYPTITIGGSVTNGGATPAGIGDLATAVFNIGPLLTWSFPNILVARAHVAETSAQASAALATFDSVVLQALRDTEKALATYAAELDHLGALRGGHDNAKAAVVLARIQYRAGTASFLDVLAAEATLVNTSQALAASQHAVSTDQIAVFQQLGGGWEGAPAVTPPAIPKR